MKRGSIMIEERYIEDEIEDIESELLSISEYDVYFNVDDRLIINIDRHKEELERRLSFLKNVLSDIYEGV